MDQANTKLTVNFSLRKYTLIDW